MADVEDVNSEDDLVSASGFVIYKAEGFGEPHPTTVLESCTMSMVKAPEITYNLISSPEAPGLSNLQHETVSRICQRNSVILPSGERAGFLLGDGTGIGKGRQIAGVIVENLRRGYSQHAIWITASYDLELDADRDLKACECPVPLINMRDFNGKSDVPTEGVLFMTYRALTAVSEQKILFWKFMNMIGGKDFQGTLAFDEAHKAKSFGSKKRSAVGLAVVKLQEKLPLARVVYATATGATDICHLAYMSRLGLWGVGTMFDDWRQFVETMENRGVGAMELMALDLKTNGAYVSRMIGFVGVKFRTEHVERTPHFELLYSLSCEIWTVMNRIRLMLRTGKLAARFWSHQQAYFAALCVACKVERVVQLTKKETHVPPHLKRAVVIGLQHTGETAYRKSLRPGTGGPTSVLMFCLEMCFNILGIPIPKKESEPARKRAKLELSSSSSSSTSSDSSDSSSQSTSESDDMSSIVGEPAPWSSTESDSSSSSQLSSTSTRSRVNVKKKSIPGVTKTLTDKAKELYLRIQDIAPLNTLDLLISEFGGEDEVAELTGRAYSAKNRADGMSYSTRRRSTTLQACSSVNNKERAAFQNGSKDVAILTDACSVGMSLHCVPNWVAERRGFINRQRVHITMEVPWSGEKAVQQLGRTNRTGQTFPPEYIFVLSPIPAENRFISAVFQRLKIMGAISHADRNSSKLGLDCKFGSDKVCSLEALNKLLSKVKRKKILQHEEILSALGSSGLLKTTNNGELKWKSDPNIINKFMNRSFMFPLDLQEFVIQELDTMAVKIEKEKRRNDTLDDGIKDFSPSYQTDATVRETCHYINAQKNIMLELRKVEVDRGMSWSQLRQFVEMLQRTASNYFLCRGKGRVMFCAKAPQAEDVYDVYYPDCGRVGEIKQEQVKNLGYQLIPIEAAEFEWRKIHAKSKNYTCIHKLRNTSCQRRNCQVNSRVKRYFVLSGSIMRVWDSILKCINVSDQWNEVGDRKRKTRGKRAINSVAEPKEESVLTIAKFSISTDRCIIGVIIPSNRVDLVREFLSKLCPSQPQE